MNGADRRGRQGKHAYLATSRVGQRGSPCRPSLLAPFTFAPLILGAVYSRRCLPVTHRTLVFVTPMSHFDDLGGETGIRALVDRFYDLMDTAPEAVHVRALHATSLKASREKLYLFLTGWTGGPDLYVEQFGHPKLRMRHFPFAIGARERDEWLWCMDQALTEHAMSEELRGSLRLRMHQLADHMRNQPE